MSFPNHVLLSIVIPAFNEADHLPDLLACLADQRGVTFEVVVADGGSSDGTKEYLRECQATVPYALRLIESPRGRARQMNAAAREARGQYLLFLHADSGFGNSDTLASALEALRDAIDRAGHGRVAGRFALRFVRSESEPSLPFYFYEAKAALDRTGCIHGDQGFLLPRRFWEEIGPFDEHLSVLEDTFFADRVRQAGLWILLPGEIRTSARRFEVEGLRQRQTLNALVMNFAAIGWDDFFREAAGIYRSQDQTAQLRLLPFLELIRRLLQPLPPGSRFRLWYRTGGYVRRNAWQIAFLFDVRRAFRSGISPSRIDTSILDRYVPLFEKATDNIPGRFAATVLVWTWFHLTLLRCRVVEEH